MKRPRKVTPRGKKSAHLHAMIDAIRAMYGLDPIPRN